MTVSEPETRRQLAAAFDSAPVGMAVTTGSGVLAQANDALAGLLRHPVEALLGRRLEDLAASAAAASITTGRAQMPADGLLSTLPTADCGAPTAPSHRWA